MEVLQGRSFHRPQHKKLSKNSRVLLLLPFPIVFNMANGAKETVTEQLITPIKLYGNKHVTPKIMSSPKFPIFIMNMKGLGQDVILGRDAIQFFGIETCLGPVGTTRITDGHQPVLPPEFYGEEAHSEIESEDEDTAAHFSECDTCLYTHPSYKLNRPVFEQICQKLDCFPNFDGFAARWNRQLGRWCGLHKGEGTPWVNFFRQNKHSLPNNTLLYLNPLWRDLDKTVAWLERQTEDGGKI